MMLHMRTTVRIDDDLLKELKQRAALENLSFTRMLNRTLRQGLHSLASDGNKRQPYREQPVSMGKPRIDTVKSLSLAAGLEDDEVARELQLRK
jgi:hypothetical protein